MTGVLEVADRGSGERGMRAVIREEAERLVREHGAEAYETARAAVRKARRRGNKRLVEFMEKV